MTKLYNTKKLPLSIEPPKSLIYAANTLQFFSHRLAVLFTQKLFATPVKFSTPERERFMEKSAQKKVLTIKSIAQKVHILSYGYSKKKILLVHGWSGRSTQLFSFADRLLEKGYMVISFDGPAHGKSTGKTTAIPDFLETITAINDEYGPFHAAIGHSFGGMCLYNAVANGFKIKNLVTIGAGDTVSEIINNFTNNLKLKPLIGKNIKTYFDQKWRTNIDTYSSSNNAKNISIPTLVIHDSQDGDVAVSCAQNIRQNLQNGTLLITKGLGHTKILRNKDVVNHTINFIIQNE
ncbi:alpha/beta fold hydrolase [Tenacibaculum maritimum]|uniref:alpha/beta fold hydrolase n=1 Tax=Tenacibaculum maritimum TaxID=107401 RepID=UPI0012E4FA40|nr:alpha/beta hydrolase [Tenacibaculum maritimum]CAA0232077.1 conserved hypothetical protein [Tenacibaculum maritimum]